MIYKAKRKHNRIDAIKLAKLLYLDAVPKVHVPPDAVRAWRRTIEFRQRLLKLRVMAKNRTRAFLRERGMAAPMNLWTVKGRQWLRSLEREGFELDEAGAMHRDLLVDELEQCTAKIKRVEKYLDGLAAKHAGVTLLKTIPGIGPRTAEALAAYIDDASRFSSLKSVGAYFGLVPCQDASANKNRLGHITGDGPGTVRKLLCEAAWTAVRCNPTVKSFYERIVRDDPDRKKIAIVAVAHYLVRVAVAMLKSGECWRESNRSRKQETPEPTPTDGGGATPSRPQGFSPPPGTITKAQASSPPPPHSASHFPPEQGGKRSTKAKRTRKAEDHSHNMEAVLMT